jgi:hypothetical protein
MALNPFQMVFGGSNQTSTSSSTPSNMNPFTSALAPQLMQLYGQGPQQYNGNLQPQMTGAQQGSLNNLPGMVAPGNQANSYINNVLNGSYMPGGAQGNPFLTSTVNAAINPIKESLDTTINQNLPTAFAGQGQQVQGTGSSAFSNAKALAVQSAANAEAGAASQIGSSAYNAGISQQNTALQVQPQEVNSAINVLQAQLLPTLLQQQGITNGLQAFQENVQSFLGFLQNMSGLAMPVIGNTQTSTGNASSTPGILSGITGLFKGASQAAGALGAPGGG